MATSRIHNPSLKSPIDYSNGDSFLNTVLPDGNPADVSYNRTLGDIIREILTPVVIGSVIVDGLNDASCDLRSEFEKRVADFDLSSVEPENVVEEEISSNCSRSCFSSCSLLTLSVLQCLCFRMGRLEDSVVVYCLAIWGAGSKKRLDNFIALCQNNFHWSVAKEDFVILDRLTQSRVRRNPGLLVRV